MNKEEEIAWHTRARNLRDMFVKWCLDDAETPTQELLIDFLNKLEVTDIFMRDCVADYLEYDIRIGAFD